MKKILQSVTAFVVAFAMVAAPVADAQQRGRQANGATHSSANGNRPSSSRPGHSSGNRPGNSGNHRPSTPGNTRPGNSHRPGESGNHGGNRPGNRPGNNHGYRPGTGPVAPRPDHRPNGSHRPGTTPGNHNRPGHNPPGHHHHHHHHRPTPPRPPRHDHHYHHHVPFFGHYHRPVPPPRWHYHSGGPVFGTILGVALGTAIGVSINSLVNSGYTVSSYGNDVVYLTNVPQMNYTWPDAALYYNNGILSGSQFTYLSPYYDMSRYNNLYGMLTSQYGMPVQTMNQGGIMSATWFGPANRYVTLSFNSQYGGNYYTTLSFGN